MKKLADAENLKNNKNIEGIDIYKVQTTTTIEIVFVLASWAHLLIF